MNQQDYTGYIRFETEQVQPANGRDEFGSGQVQFGEGQVQSGS